VEWIVYCLGTLKWKERMENMGELGDFPEIWSGTLPADPVVEGYYMPPDLRSVFRAVNTTGNGNCCFNAASIDLVGDESIAGELRLRAAYHILDHKKAYDQAINDPTLERYNIDQELVNTLTDRC